MLSPRFCSGPPSRRSFLQASFWGLGAYGMGLSGSPWAAAREASTLTGAGSERTLSDTQPHLGPAPTTTDQPACIFIWLPGGPPHMEMYDMKPDAPSDYRGEFRPVATNVPGIEVCELFPEHARLADKYAIIRSVHHTFSDHGGGHKRFMTGRDPKEPTGFVNDTPACGSMLAKCLSDRQASDLNYVLMTDGGRGHIDTFSLGTAYLGASYGPFTLAGDPSDPQFRVHNLTLNAEMENRLTDRRTLLTGLDRLRRDVDNSRMMEAMDALQQRAANLLLGGRVRHAFDLSQETDAAKDRYGRHAWGYRALMARRLVEAGCPFVTVVWENPYVSGVPFLKSGTYNWDSHAVNCHLFQDARVRFPIYDRTVGALIEDLYARGLDRRVLLVITGEFGRTPRLEYRPGSQTKSVQPGRDHWPQAMSMLVSGGGLRMGQIIGSTNRKGEEPRDRPLSPNDVWATIFRHLGVDYRQELRDLQGRPLPMLPHGEPIGELFT